MSTPTDSLSRINVNGTKLAYRESGTGEPLVLVHGHLSDYRTWTALENKLSSNFRVFSYSRRFSWPNEPIKDGEPQPWEQDALDLEVFIETLDIGPVHALGNSSGATVILWLAKTKSHLFRTLILEEPPVMTLFIPSLPPSPLAALSFFFQHPISFFYVMYYGATTIGPAIDMAKKDDYDGAVSTFGTGCLGSHFWPHAVADSDRKKQIDDNSRIICHFLRYNNLPVYTAEHAKNIKVPTLVLTGIDGPYSQQCIDAELIRVCGAAKKRETKIQHAGHFAHEDNPEAVFKAIVEFVKSGSAE